MRDFNDYGTPYASPEEQEEARRKKFAAWIDKRPEELSREFPEVLIPGWLYQGRRLMVTGKPIIGKGLFLLQTAFCLATGAPFLGKKLGEPKRVYHVDFELMEASLHERLWLACEHFARGRKEERDRLWKLVNENMAVLAAIDHPELNDDPDFFAEITARSILGRKPVLISLDPLWQICPSELDEEKLRGFLKKLRIFTRESGTGPSYTHHQTKGEQLKKDVIDRFAGRNDLARDCATMVALSELDNQGHIQVDVRTNDWAQPEPFVIKLAYPVFEPDYEVEPIRINPSGSPKARRSLGEVLELIPGSEGAISQDVFIEKAKQSLDLGRDKALRMLRILCEQKKVEEILLPSPKRGQKPKGYRRKEA